MEDKTFRIRLSAVAAKELLGIPGMQGSPDAKAISDICIGQAQTALSKFVSSSEDMERSQELISALGPELIQYVASGILLSSVQITRHLRNTYLNN